MDRTIEERLEALEERNMALSCTLKVFLMGTPAVGRRRLCEKACASLEHLYAEDRITEDGHPRIQKVLAEIEALLGPFPPRPDKG